MAEQLFVTVAPNGQTFKCVESQLWKTAGKDPFGRDLTVGQKKRHGVE